MDAMTTPTDREKMQLNNNPIVRFLFSEIERRKINHRDLSAEAGIGHTSLSGWRRRTMPRVDDLEAVLNVLGYSLALKATAPRVRGKGKPVSGNANAQQKKAEIAHPE